MSNIDTYCLNCKEHSSFIVDELFRSRHGRHYAKGECSNCSKRVQKLIQKTTYQEYLEDPDIEIYYK